MLHLPLSHKWDIFLSHTSSSLSHFLSLLFHNALLFCYINRLLSIRPFLHSLPKKSNCYSVSSLHSLNSPLLHPSRIVLNRISDLKLLKTPVCYECLLSINHSFFPTSLPTHSSHPSLSKQPSHSSPSKPPSYLSQKPPLTFLPPFIPLTHLPQLVKQCYGTDMSWGLEHWPQSSLRYPKPWTHSLLRFILLQLMPRSRGQL